MSDLDDLARAAQELPRAAHSAGGDVPYAAYRPRAVVPHTNRVAAGVCGILLGTLGIHKFIIGATGAGLIMLLVSLLTCGFGEAVMGVIGLIEGIIYLTKSEEQFYREYVVQRRSWF